MTPLYTIGQNVWRASAEPQEKYVVCPDCGGTKHFRAVMWDGTEHTLDCSGCSQGFEGPRGHLTVYEQTPCADQGCVTGIEIRGDGIEYRVTNSSGLTHICDEADIFLLMASALARASVKGAGYLQAQIDRIAQKEKPHRTWSWHVHYHRACIRRAEKEVAYHQSQLAVARSKAKDEKVAP